MKMTAKSAALAGTLLITAVLTLSFQNCSSSGAGGSNGDSAAAAAATGTDGATPTPTPGSTPSPTPSPTPTPTPLSVAFVLGSNAGGFINPFGPTPAPRSMVEKVTLSSMVRSQVIDLGTMSATSLAVDSSRKVLYVNGGAQGQIVKFDADSGLMLNTLSGVTNVKNLILSADNSILFAQTAAGLTAINLTNGVTYVLPLANGGDQNISFALSRDGKTIANVAASNPYVVSLIDVSDVTTMKYFARVGITTTSNGNCTAAPGAVTFGADGKVLVADNNCDALYQIDIAAKAQATIYDINLGRDGAGAAFTGLIYDPASGIALQTKESATSSGLAPVFALMNPTTLTQKFTATLPVPNIPPSALALLPGSKAFFGIDSSNATIGSSIGTVDLTTGLMTMSGYTFATPGLSIKSIQVK